VGDEKTARGLSGVGRFSLCCAPSTGSSLVRPSIPPRLVRRGRQDSQLLSSRYRLLAARPLVDPAARARRSPPDGRRIHLCHRNSRTVSAVQRRASAADAPTSTLGGAGRRWPCLEVGSGANGTTIRLENPEAPRICLDGAFRHVYYKHMSHFTTGSLRRYFQQAGFRLEDAPRSRSVRPAPGAPCKRRQLGDHRARRALRDRRQSAPRENPCTPLASGARRRRAWFALEDVWSLGERVHRRTSPDLVIVMNSVSIAEIRSNLAELGLRPKVQTL
jgi:hypothetical protein